MITRRQPIDFHAIAMETGITNGTVGHNGLGWIVRDNNCNSHMSCALIDPPEMLLGEKRVTIENKQWCFHND